MTNKTAIIIGAGPAGLTAAYELATRTAIRPLVLEAADCVGGISRTVCYKGNRIDLGGHRFFSKSDRVMAWWRDMLPMLVRQRKSRVYYTRKFFDYPIGLSADTILKLGLWRTARIGMSYLWRSLRPIPNETNLEQFLINRFGRQLYLTFFKSYTEKVWGVPCDRIDAAWGAQRIKGLSIRRAVAHALARPFRRRADLSQKSTETTLIEQFLYPQFGPGQMWQRAAERVVTAGGRIVHNANVVGVRVSDGRVAAVETVGPDGGRQTFAGDYFFSSMAIKDLVRAMGPAAPDAVRDVSEALMYRDFVTVGLLLNKLKIGDRKSPDGRLRDNWIYVQEPDVRVGRVQIFNNWSPHMVADPGKTWVGLEYFCFEGDDLWRRPDAGMIELAREELARIGLVDPPDVLDGVVIRQEKTYPAYFGGYDRFDVVRGWLDGLSNLFCVGRNGMHRYNNQDHSMLTAMTAVDNILAQRADKSNIWSVNAEQEYHEQK